MDGLHAGMQGDSRQFVTQLYVLHQDDGEESAGLLIRLLRDVLPGTGTPLKSARRNREHLRHIWANTT